MGEDAAGASQYAPLVWVAKYHFCIIELLNRSFTQNSQFPLMDSDSASNNDPLVRPVDYMEETDRRSSLAVLALLEAAFRRDYQFRVKRKLKDGLSRVFRAKYKHKQHSVSLEREIFDAWAKHTSGACVLIGDLHGAFRFRHWLAHGQYWTPKLGRKYDFKYLYRLADAVLSALPLQGIEEE